MYTWKFMLSMLSIFLRRSSAADDDDGDDGDNGFILSISTTSGPDNDDDDVVQFGSRRPGLTCGCGGRRSLNFGVDPAGIARFYVLRLTRSFLCLVV